MLHVPPPLANLCTRHGIELDGLSDAELIELVPDIIGAIQREQRVGRARQREIATKTALAVKVRESLRIANPGIVRDEVLPVRAARPVEPTNDCFDAFPLFSAMEGRE